MRLEEFKYQVDKFGITHQHIRIEEFKYQVDKFWITHQHNNWPIYELQYTDGSSCFKGIAFKFGAAGSTGSTAGSEGIVLPASSS